MTTKQIQVCVLTYKRPEMLRSALQSLQRQELKDLEVSLHILVIDNDAERSGQPVFDQVFAGSQIPARYVVELQQGISRARNRALDESSDADFMAFLDDDEVADDHWVARLLEVQAAYDADVVTGPVAPRYVKSPQWIIRGGFFERRTKTTGQDIEYIATNNVLLRSGLATRFRFDLRFEKTGGEDNLFFMQLKSFGARMVWADDAIVYETIPEQRTTFKWILLRSYSEANRFTKCCTQTAPGLATIVWRVSKACGGFAVGVLMLPAGLAGRHRTVRGLVLMSRAVGTIHALMGFTPAYYTATNSQPSPERGKLAS